jgi:hypothetical protein
MGARDIGGTRIELARARSLELLDSAGDTAVTVLAWDGVMRPATPPLAVMSRARQAVGELEAVDYGAADGALLRALRRIGEEPGERRIVLVSDHEPGTLEEGVVFIPAGSRASNTALVAADLTEVSAAHQELFFGLEHFGEGPVKASLVIERVLGDEVELVDAREVELAPGARGSVTLAVREPGLYRAQLKGTDALALDDIAWVRYSPLPVQDVALVGEPPEPLRRAIAAIHEATGAVRLVESAGDETMNIYAAPGPAPLLPAVYLLPAGAPPGVGAGAGKAADDAPARPARHGLWRGAGVPDIRVPEVFPATAARFMQPLLETGPGAALALLRRDDSRVDDLLVCFALDDSGGGFASRVAFVIFWENWFDAGRRLRDPLPRGAVSTRDVSEVALIPGRGQFRYRLATDEEQLGGRPGESLRLESAGVYVFDGLPGPAPRQLGVSLLDPEESELGFAGEWNAAAAIEALAAQDKKGERADLPLYPWLALLAAACVLFEWFWFRRNYPVNEAGPRRRPAKSA